MNHYVLCEYIIVFSFVSSLERQKKNVQISWKKNITYEMRFR